MINMHRLGIVLGLQILSLLGIDMLYGAGYRIR